MISQKTFIGELFTQYHACKHKNGHYYLSYLFKANIIFKSVQADLLDAGQLGNQDFLSFSTD